MLKSKVVAGNQTLHAGKYFLGLELLHAGVSDGTCGEIAAEAKKVLILDDLVWRAHRALENGISGAEYGDDWCSHRRRYVHRTRIVRDKHPTAGEDRSELFQIARRDKGRGM